MGVCSPGKIILLHAGITGNISTLVSDVVAETLAITLLLIYPVSETLP